MADVTDLDELVVRVLAPNPSPATLDGTNSYLLGVPGSGEVVCVDPGPALPAHRAALERAAEARDAEIVAVVLTHHHRDHSEAATWAEGWGVPLHAADPALIDVPARGLADGAALDFAGCRIEAVATPGHASDHLCLRVGETGAVLTGDHILGRGTTVVAWPDGDMAAYIGSLERLRSIDAPVLYPGHGPAVTRPREVVDGYIAHRGERERQILRALQEGRDSPAGIVELVYADVAAHLHPLAQRSVRAHLAKLVDEGRVREEHGRFQPA